MSGSASLAHALLSLGLFSSGYFDKLFAGGKLTFAGGLSMLFAALATVVLEVGARQAQHWTVSGSQRATVWLLILSVLHTMTPSASGWFEPATWPGYLPPLTLLATIPSAIAVSVWVLRRPSA